MVSKRVVAEFAVDKMVSFPIVGSEEGAYENMHALPFGDGKYILDNSPFYVYGVSYLDIVFANEEDERLVFSSIYSRGGHSTYRIKLPKGCDHSYFIEKWKPLRELGCTYEGTSAGERRLYAIDVPPDSDIYEVYRVLQTAEDEGLWQFEEAHYCAPEERPHHQ